MTTAAVSYDVIHVACNAGYFLEIVQLASWYGLLWQEEILKPARHGRGGRVRVYSRTYGLETAARDERRDAGGRAEERTRASGRASKQAVDRLGGRYNSRAAATASRAAASSSRTAASDSGQSIGRVRMRKRRLYSIKRKDKKWRKGKQS